MPPPCKWGARIPVRGAVSGPYSMACELYGAERFVMATIEDPETARGLLEFCAEVTIAYGLAFIERGADPIVFDSRATPQLASPRVFHSLIAPLYRHLIMPRWKAAGAREIPLIIGGNTVSLLDDLLTCGATQLLCDAPCELVIFRDKCATAGMAFRANVDSRLVLRVAYDTPPAHVLAIRDALSSNS